MSDVEIKLLIEKSNKLNNIYKYIDFDNLTINSNFKEEEIPEDIKHLLSKLKLQFFGRYNSNKFKRVVLPYYLQTNNIIQLFKIILNKTIKEEEIQNIIKLYNENNYSIICKNDKEYMRFDNNSKYDILLNKMNSIYDNLIQKKLSSRLLNAYNEKKYTITNIEIDDNKYKFNFLNEPIEIILINIYDNIEIKNTTKYNTNYHFEDINLSITNYYENQNQEDNIYGNLQNDYSQYILLEKIIPYINTSFFKTIEDIMLIESIIDEETINNLWKTYNTVNTKIIKEIDNYYICKKTKEIIYKESKRWIIPRRFFSLIIYISRLYNESFIIDEELEDLKFLYIEILNHFESYNKTYNLIELNNNIIISFDKWFHENYKLSVDYIEEQYLNIIKGKIISKLNSLDIVKNARTQINNSKKKIMDHLNDNLINIKKITNDVIANPEKAINDGISSITKMTNDVIANPEKTINDGMSSIKNLELFNSQDTTEKLGGFEFENSFLSETFIQNRVQRWVSGPKNTDIYYPTIIQFVDDYVNDEHDIDLISYKNKEKICKEISKLKNTIEEDTKNIKYLLPKTFFDNENFMEKYKEEIENIDKQKISH
jgi:hypothetical protein